ncbi:MAG: toll/interleukin-1 receptor domain-containing protein [Planctomycetes bacterium]|nr:toll/interleukin-1 receptor domain-containing protein [Planctomycetota bacterium]
MTGRIFISYRRDDSFLLAGSICAALRARLGTDNAVFMDTTINPGDDWPTEIRTALEQALTVLVVVVDWDKWLAVQPRGRRRIDNPKDWVRQEISTALIQDKKIIPVLIEPNDQMILAEDLPDDIQRLADKQQTCLRKATWNQDLKQLVDTLCPGLPDNGAAGDSKPTKSPPPSLSESIIAYLTRLAHETSRLKLLGMCKSICRLPRPTCRCGRSWSDRWSSTAPNA